MSSPSEIGFRPPERPLRADRSIRPNQLQVHRPGQRLTPEALEACRLGLDPRRGCEVCGSVDAPHLVADARDGWKRPRRLCGLCCDRVLERRRREALEREAA